MAQVAEYKGRKYKLAWQGTTKYGERAKLQFFDGSKEFWVDASTIRITESNSSEPRGRGFRRAECAECGEWINSPNQRCWETGLNCFAE